MAALARVTRYARWRSAPQGTFARPEGIDADAAHAVVRALELDGERLLDDDTTVRLLACYGVGVVPFRVVTSADDAVRAAGELGYPVAMKSTDDRLRHRTDLVGVRLDLSGEEAVRTAYAMLAGMSERPDVYVQRMAPKGISCVLGLQDDPSFGTLVSFGLSGLVSDLLGDRAYRAVPLTDADAAALVRAPKAAPLLAGYRGDEPADLPALQDLVLRLAALAEDLPEVRELALEPVLASAAGAYVSSARITLGPPPSRHDTGPRRLRSPGGAR